MNTHKRARRLTALAIAALLLSSLWLVVAEEAPLHRLLARIPQSALTGMQPYISYADLDALVRARPGVTVPAHDQDMAEFLRTPQGAAYRGALWGSSAGYNAWALQLMQAHEFQRSMGITMPQIHQTMELGMPPGQLVFLQGSFDADSVRAALGTKGYQAQQSPGMELWCPDGDCSIGAFMDMAKRDANFLFGGDLGRRWPVTVDETLLAAGPQGQAMQTMAAQSGPMLSEDDILMALVRAVSTPDGQEEGRLVQLLITAPDMVMPPPIDLTALTPQEPAGGPPTEPMGLLALAHVDTEEAMWVVLAVSYADASQAHSAQQRLARSLPDARISTGQALLPMVEQMGGTAQPQRVEPGGEGQGVLLIPFRFPTQAEATAANPGEPSAIPFRQFIRMAMQRDLGWLND